MDNKSAPFIYGNTVSGTYFTNREEELKRLKSNFKNGLNTIILSPRRWGKSSLVERAIKECNFRKGNMRLVLLDLFTVSNEHEFLEAFAREVIKSTSSRWQDWVEGAKDLFSHLIPKVSIGIDPNTDFSLSFDWEELSRHADKILALPQTIAAKKGLRIVICLDEFQNLATMDGYEQLEKKMRAIWQRQKDVSYCLFGSKRHMLSDIFNDSSKPFYRFGELMFLKKIERKKWVRFIVKGFDRTGKSIAKTDAEYIAKIMSDHSWYVQQLAHYTWVKTKKTADRSIIDRAINELVAANSPLYEREIEIMSSTQTNLLKAIYKGESKLTSKAVMKNYRVGTPRNVAKNRDMMLSRDMIDLSEGEFSFLDPAFSLWFGRRFFGE